MSCPVCVSDTYLVLIDFCYSLQDVILSIVFAVGYVAVGIASAFYANVINAGIPFTLFNAMAASTVST